MENFARLIHERLNVNNLSNSYTFDLYSAINNAKFLSEQLKSEILQPANIFEQNIVLKRLLFENFPKEQESRIAAYFWIIRKWGGIGAFKEGTSNIELIESFLSCLAEGGQTNKFHNRISSLSKVASFVNPDKYAIYDARAIYTLNWLISEVIAERPDFDIRFFPIGDVSRNKMIKDRPFQLIYRRCSNLKEFNKGEAYTRYCSLLAALNTYLFPEFPTELFRTEMLLFANIESAYKNLA